MCALVSALDFTHKTFWRLTGVIISAPLLLLMDSPTVKHLSLFDHLPVSLGQFQLYADANRASVKGFCDALCGLWVTPPG